MKKIHVLHVLNSAYGGSAFSTFQLIEALKVRNIHSSLVCFNNANAEQQEKIRALVDNRVLFIPLYWTNKRIRVTWWKRPILEALSVWSTWWGHKYQSQIDALIKKNQVNLVHTSTIVNREGAIAASRNGLPHIWHVRELIGPHAHYNFPRFQSWLAYVERNADFLIANSEVTFKNLAMYFQQSKIKCIPNGIDPSVYKVKVHKNIEKLVVGMVGNVTSRWKNHSFFIRVAVHFRDNPGVSFRIYGELPPDTDSYYKGLKDIVLQNGLTDKVTFVGHQRNESIMSDIDILFHPTGRESFGRIFTEAMAGGIPIIAADEGGAIELVRNDINGFRVTEDDTLAAAAALKKLLNSAELRDQLGKNGRMIVEKEYSLRLLEERISDLYDKLVKSN